MANKELITDFIDERAFEQFERLKRELKESQDDFSELVKVISALNIELSKSKNVDSLAEPALIRIEDIFTPNPATIGKHADLAVPAKLMIRQVISAIAVVESMQEITKVYEPVGIISKANIVNALSHI